MVRQLFFALVVVGALASIAQAQSTDDLCMTTVMDSMVTALGMSDSITVSGDCDSAVGSRQLGLFKITVATLVKQDSCNVHATIIGYMDSIVNYCELPVLRGIAPHANGGPEVSYTGTRLRVDGRSLPDGDIVVRLFDDCGRCVRSLSAPGGGDVSWNFAGRRGSLTCAVEVEGRLVAVRRIVAVR